MALTVGVYAWPAHAHAVAVVAVVALTVVNFVGVQKSALLTRVIVAVVLAVLAAVVVVVLGSGDPDARAPGVRQRRQPRRRPAGGRAAVLRVRRLRTHRHPRRGGARPGPHDSPGHPASRSASRSSCTPRSRSRCWPSWAHDAGVGDGPAGRGGRLGGHPGFVRSCGSARRWPRSVRCLRSSSGCPAPPWRWPATGTCPSAVGRRTSAVRQPAPRRDRGRRRGGGAGRGGRRARRDRLLLVRRAALLRHRQRRGNDLPSKLIPALGFTGCVVLAFSLPASSVLTGAGVVVLGAAAYALHRRPERQSRN